MQKISNILFGIGIILIVQTYTAEYAFTILLVLCPYHIVFNKGGI
jgi:hypothetical protein